MAPSCLEFSGLAFFHFKYSQYEPNHSERKFNFFFKYAHIANYYTLKYSSDFTELFFNVMWPATKFE